MTGTAVDIRDNFRKAYPNDFFFICKYTAPGGASLFYGTRLLDIQLKDKDWLSVYKLSESSGCKMNNDEVQQKALSFIDDTKSITDDNTRRDQLRESLKTVFPNHNVNLFIFKKDWEYASYDKGSTAFMNEHGADICVSLS